MSGRRNQENEVPKLFISNQDSTVELTRKEYKGERDEISIIMNFVIFLILFFILPQILELIPFAGNILASSAKLVTFVIFIRDIGNFSKKIAEFLVLLNDKTINIQISPILPNDEAINIQTSPKTGYSKISDLGGLRTGIAIGEKLAGFLISRRID
ncbi:MAG: hypothetical protein F6K23_26560 [Okeania sp. SIO2C9]|uniref:hypothetical protein n=1 Tax=Okeania sp. SIO2C9 TaxID=2607791 RepID=UPI0013BF2607|nr:hypothetical protein [Okeania sp. SIO2C9]NEQ76289.1 hypothetical protein [Okeania sp. SIO2C9]